MRSPLMTRAGQTTHDIVRAAAAHFGPFIKMVARVKAKGDYQLALDLEQEALIRLWELDPTRFESADEGYVKRALRKRMQSSARAERKNWERGRTDLLDEDDGDLDDCDE